jgi:hypothetical protein
MFQPTLPDWVPESVRFRRLLALALALSLTAVSIAAATSQASSATRELPARLGDQEFWKLSEELSEPGGTFRSDNLLSNEIGFPAVIPDLIARTKPGGVYMGVGPEQNFHYIAAIKPKMVFITDIRRGNLWTQLMYKAIFEMSADRADFIALLFTKPRPANVDASGPIQAIWEAYWQVVSSDSATWARNHARIVDQLTKTHGFVFTADESMMLRDVYDAFYRFGPVITTRGVAGRGGFGGNGVTFAELTGYSPDAANPQSFLSTADNYAYVKALHEKNLIVPVSGDFGGPKAIRAIGAYLRERGGTVSAFYVSNVEQYLFQDGKQTAFYENVASLPVNEGSIFIRPYSMRRATATEPLCPIGSFLESVQKGVVTSNADALACPR